MLMVGTGETSLPQEEHANWLSNPKWSAQKTYTSNIIQSDQAEFMYLKIHMYTHTYMYATNNEKKGTVI